MTTRRFGYAFWMSRAATVTLAAAFSTGAAWVQAAPQDRAGTLVDPDDPPPPPDDVGPINLRVDPPSTLKKRHEHKVKPAKGHAPVEPERFATRPQQEIHVLTLEKDKKEKKKKKIKD